MTRQTSLPSGPLRYERTRSCFGDGVHRLALSATIMVVHPVPDNADERAPPSPDRSTRRRTSASMIACASAGSAGRSPLRESSSRTAAVVARRLGSRCAIGTIASESQSRTGTRRSAPVATDPHSRSSHDPYRTPFRAAIHCPRITLLGHRLDLQVRSGLHPLSETG